MAEQQIRRPKADDTEDDLLELQREFLRETSERQEWQHKLDAVPCPAVLKHKNLTESTDCPSGAPSSPTKIRHRNLAESEDSPFARPKQQRVVLECVEPTANVLSDICEKNVGLDSFEFVHRQPHLSEESGFPEIDSRPEVLQSEAKESEAVLPLDQLHAQIDAENRKKISQMDESEILEQQQKLVKKLDPKLLEFLKNRSQKESEPRSVPQKPTKEETVASDVKKLDAAVQNLEIIDAIPEKLDWLTDPAPSARLATDPISFDLASKCYGAFGSKREMAVSRLFDACARENRTKDGQKGFLVEEIRKSALPPSIETRMSGDELLQIACDNIEHIKHVYLNKGTDGAYVFRQFISPSTDPAWMLKPLHLLLETCLSSSGGAQKLDEKDVNMVTFLLMWIYVLHRKRISYVNACVTPVEMYWNLLSVFVLGPEFYLDILCYNYLCALFHDHLLPQIPALTFSSEAKVSGFESLTALYKQSLLEFEDSSYGDALFSHYILAPALGGDSQMKLIFWNQDRSALHRCFTLNMDKCWFGRRLCEPYSTECVEGDPQVVLAFAQALASGAVKSDTNPLLFSIAEGNVHKFLSAVNRKLLSEKESKLVASLEKVIHNL